MKKLLLFLVLAVTFNLSAQTISTTYFAKPLELNSVPASTSKADSVIVRGADKILKYVPRSEFGGGSAQTLQEILNNGYIVENTPIWINRTDGIFQDGFRLLSPLQYTSHQDGFFRIYKYDGSGDTSYSNGGIRYTKDGKNLNLGLPTPVLENFNSTFVTSINGQYADEFGNIDITGGGDSPTLEQVITAGNQATAGNSFVRFLEGFNNNSKYSRIRSSNDTSMKYSDLYVGNSNAFLFGANDAINSEVKILDGKLNLKYANTNLTSTTIEFEEPTSISTLRYPAKSSGIHVLATLDDISGGSQNLQQVIDTGNSTTNALIQMNTTYTGSTYFNMNSPVGSISISPGSTSGGGGQFYVGDNTGNNNVTIYKDGIRNIGGGYNKLFNFPAKPSGTYTLATLDDIDLQVPTLQQVLDAGSVADNSILTINDNGNNNSTQISGSNVSVINNGESLLSLFIDRLEFGSWNGDKRNTLLFDRDTNGLGTYKFPEKPSGSYVFATTDDLAKTNLTTTTLSQSDLNTAYPNGSIGLRVHCMSISGGALTYEKTSTGWVQYPVTVVP
ncbi:hypothetical protein [Flavobacterium salmonis]|uniref:Uncharacterized protein n=1 Tax=Flavobacterium salmonis TaxID=2654844 RepID=A0A6V6Z824_9FLAO|nr:hypothetical protein [Flavobacterium salmonis]CAD0007574.1 hypothetical protein FLAT13_03906 [Flavobacterium salmonis]